MTDSLASPSTSGGARTVDPALFRILVDSGMLKAQRLRYSISVICVSAKAVATELSFIDQFRGQLRATDVVAPWPPASLVVLLIDAESGDIPAVMRRITLHLAEGSWWAGVCPIHGPPRWPMTCSARRRASWNERSKTRSNTSISPERPSTSGAV